MKKVTALFLFMILALLCTTSVFAASTNATITLKDIQMIENNHVGNDWYTTAKIGKNTLTVGDSITINSKKSIKLYAEATEDDKYPDTGTKTKAISPSKYIGKDIVLKVVVVENKGRYSGNTATWEFTYSVTQ